MLDNLIIRTIPILSVSIMFLLFFTINFQYYTINLTNQYVVKKKWKKKLILKLQKKHRKNLKFFYYAFILSFLYILSYLVIFGIFFDLLTINSYLWPVNLLILSFCCFCFYYYFFNSIERNLIIKIRGYNSQIRYDKYLPILQVFLLGFFYNLSPRVIFNSAFPFTMNIIISFIVILITIKKRQNYEKLMLYFDDYYELKKKIRKINKLKEKKRKFEKRYNYENIIKIINKKIEYIENNQDKNEKKLKKRKIKRLFENTFFNDNTKKTWNDVIHIFFYISICVPLISYFIFPLLHFDVGGLDIIYYFLLFFVQFIISFRLLNRSKKYKTKSLIRGVIELILIGSNLFMLIEIFFNLLDFFLFFNLFYLFYIIWNFLILAEYPNLTSIELRDLYNAITYSFFIIILNLTKIEIFNNFEIIFYPFMAFGFVITLELLIHYYIKSKYENFNELQINNLYNYIKDVFIKIEKSSSMKDHIKNNKIQEKYFRDFFHNILDNKTEFSQIESISKSDRQTDLVLYLKNPNTRKPDKIILEFKIWWRIKSDKYHPISQILDNIGVYDNFGIIIMINPLKSKINEKYKDKIINHDSYVYNSIKDNPLDKELENHFISYHLDKLKKNIKILHIIYDLENLRC